MGFVFDNTEVYDQVRTCQMIMRSKYRSALIYGEVDVDKYLTKFNEELKQRVLIISLPKNKQFKAFMEANGI